MLSFVVASLPERGKVEREVGRYQLETVVAESKKGKVYIVETILDTRTGKIVKRQKIYLSKYKLPYKMFRKRLVDEGYKWGENTKLFNKKTVQLKVKQENGDVNIEKYIIKESIHGPIIREDNDFAYALRVVGQDQPFVFEQYFDMALSKNFDQFEKAISRLQNPFFTTMYADRDGRIMHLFGGRTPVRPKAVSYTHLTLPTKA